MTKKKWNEAKAGAEINKMQTQNAVHCNQIKMLLAERKEMERELTTVRSENSELAALRAAVRSRDNIIVTQNEQLRKYCSASAALAQSWLRAAGWRGGAIRVYDPAQPEGGAR